MGFLSLGKKENMALGMRFYMGVGVAGDVCVLPNTPYLCYFVQLSFRSFE